MLGIECDPRAPRGEGVMDVLHGECLYFRRRRRHSLVFSNSFLYLSVEMMFHSDCNCLGVMNDTVVMEDYDRYCDGESNHFGFFYFCFFFFLLPPRFAVNCFPSVAMIDWCFRSFNCLFVLMTICFWPSLTSSLLLVVLVVHLERSGQPRMHEAESRKIISNNKNKIPLFFALQFKSLFIGCYPKKETKIERMKSEYLSLVTHLSFKYLQSLVPNATYARVCY